MSRNIDLKAILTTIQSALDKLGANKTLRKHVESLAKAAGADCASGNKKAKKSVKVDKKSAKKEKEAVKKWRGSEAKKHAHAPSKKHEHRLESRTKKNAADKPERKVRNTDDGNKTVVKHARLRAVKVKKTNAAVETPSKKREVKKQTKTAKPVKPVNKRSAKVPSKKVAAKKIAKKSAKKARK